MSFSHIFHRTDKLKKNAEQDRHSWMFSKASVINVALVLALFSSFSMKSYAADSMTDSLAKLENKFFQHDYSKDTNAERLDRLEKMVFGETKTGNDDDRVKALLGTVPNLNTNTTEPVAEKTNSDQKTKPKEQTETAKAEPEESTLTESSKYPAVTAIENKLFGKDYAGEPVSQRLDRLETKVFGKTSDIKDLSERVDRIKDRTGVDITKQAPPGSDWAEDDDQMPITRQIPELGNRQQNSGVLDDPDSLGLKPFTGGRYGFQPQGDSLPPAAPSGRYGYAPPAVSSANIAGMGLNQQVGALEMEIFGKTSGHAPLTARVGRLESAVFPNEKPETDKPLPDRVNRLLAAVPISNKNKIAHNGKPKKSKDDFDNLNSLDPTLPGSSSSGGGLSKLFGFFTGGSMAGFPMTSTMMPAGLVRDPSTGLLYNPTTGALIDPTTGAVIGQRGGVAGVPSPMQMQMGGTNPYGTQYGYGPGIRFGFGGRRIGGWP